MFITALVLLVFLLDLNVAEARQVTVSGPGEVGIGERLDLVCRVSPATTASLSWSHNGHSPPQSVVSGRATVRNSVTSRQVSSVLTISGAEAGDTGIYTCDNDVSSLHSLVVKGSNSVSARSACGDCWSKAITIDCSFFDCLECLHGCGDGGYLLAYGKVMCERFRAYSSSFYTQSGRAWLNDSLLCLMSELWEGYGKTPVSGGACPKLMDDGHTWRTTCFLQAGYCEVRRNMANWWAITRLFSTSDIWTWRLVPAIYQTDRGCEARVMGSLWSWFTSTFNLYSNEKK